jgi:hypothetical protein
MFPFIFFKMSLEYKTIPSWALVAHTCHPSYSGGRDQEDRGSKTTHGNSLRDPILKTPITRKGWWSGSRCGSCVQAPIPHTHTRRLAIVLFSFLFCFVV